MRNGSKPADSSLPGYESQERAKFVNAHPVRLHEQVNDWLAKDLLKARFADEHARLPYPHPTGILNHYDLKMIRRRTGTCH